MLSNVGVSCWYCRRRWEIFSDGPLPGKSLCGFALCFCVMTTCCSRSKIILPSCLFLLCVSVSSLEWRSSPLDCGHGAKRWVHCFCLHVTITYMNKFTVWIISVIDTCKQSINQADDLHPSPVVHIHLSAQNARSGFTVSERNVILSERNAPLNNGQKKVSDAFHRFIHCVLPVLGASEEGSLVSFQVSLLSLKSPYRLK